MSLTQPADRSRRALAWPATAITLVALALRVFRLDAQSLWVDEVITWRASQGSLQELLLGTGHYLSIGHSLYYAITHAFLRLGDSEIALRLPSVVFGTLSVPLIHGLGRQWLGGQVGMAAAVLLAISPLHVYYSQEARPYAALLFFALLALVCSARAVTGGKVWRAAFVASYTAALLSHPVALGFVPVVAMSMALIHRIEPRAWAGTLIALGTVTAAILVVLLTLQLGGPSGMRSAGPFALAYTAWTFATGFSLGPSVRELHSANRVRIAFGYSPLVLPILAAYTGLVLNGGIRAWKDSPRMAMLLMVWVFLAVGLLLLGSRVTGQPYNVRYVILALPPFLFLVAKGIGALPGGRTSRVVAWTLLLVVSAISLRNYYFEPRYEREDYRSAVRRLRAEVEPGDLVLLSVPYTQDMLEYYDPGSVEVVAFPRAETGPGHLVPTEVGWQKELDEVTAGRERFWVLLSRTFHGSVGDRLVPYLDRRMRRVRDVERAGVRLILYETHDVSRTDDGS